MIARGDLPVDVTLRDGREVTVRAVRPDDAEEIRRAFERLSDDSRFYRFMRPKHSLDPDALQRGLHPRAGREHAIVATPRTGRTGDIVGGAQYVASSDASSEHCEFAVTVDEDWRRCGLAHALLQLLLRHARRDGYRSIEGWAIAANAPMLAVARALGFSIEPVPGDAGVLHLRKPLRTAKPRAAPPAAAPRTRTRPA